MVNLRILAVAAVVLAGCSAAPANDQQPVGESQDHLLAGRRLSETEIATLLREAGFPESSVGQMVCTAKYESSFYERASHTNGNGTTDYGLFQINSVHLRDAGCPSTATGLYDAATNTRCAYRVWKSQGIRAWYGYQKHRAECDRYAAPGVDQTTPTAPTNPSDPTNPGDPTDPYAQEDAGSCWSGTLDDMEPSGTCVPSKYDGAWYQCHAGQWFAGGEDGSGPYGACASTNPL